MTTTLDTVRRLIGQRKKITRDEMVDILLALDMDIVAQSTITGRFADGTLLVGGQTVRAVRSGDASMPPSARSIDTAATAEAERRATARAWERMCDDICCISVFPPSPGYAGCIRYDETGRMAPTQHATLMFVHERLGDYEYDQIGQMRRRAERVLIVRGEPTVDAPPTPTVAPWVTRMRKDSRIDGTWIRLHDDGTLEMRDPNDGQSSDPRRTHRYQYRIEQDGHLVVARRLPPETVGDAYLDTGVPEWEPRDPGGLVAELLARMYDEMFD